MKEPKSIPELIHDRVFLEGGTLHRWLNGARFRRIEPAPMINSRTVSSPTEIEDDSGFADFSPSAELRALMVRNAEELRQYVADMVAGWRVESARPTPRWVGSSSPRSGLLLTRRGGDSCDCHALGSSEFSPAEGVLGASAGVSAGVGGPSGGSEAGVKLEHREISAE